MHIIKSGITFALVLVVCSVLLAGCITIKTGGKTSATSTVSEPIIGEWSMARAGIQPNLPIPVMLVNQVVPEKSTWKFQRVNGKLKLTCDGNDTWYKVPFGVSVNKKEVSVSESSDKYTFSGGGSIDLSGASMVISQMMGQKIEQASADFTDNNAVSFTQGKNSIQAVIKITASGKYYGEMETGGMKWKSIQQNMTVTYNGVRK